MQWNLGKGNNPVLQNDCCGTAEACIQHFLECKTEHCLPVPQLMPASVSSCMYRRRLKTLKTMKLSLVLSVGHDLTTMPRMADSLRHAALIYLQVLHLLIIYPTFSSRRPASCSRPLQARHAQHIPSCPNPFSCLHQDRSRDYAKRVF